MTSAISLFKNSDFCLELTNQCVLSSLIKRKKKCLESNIMLSPIRKHAYGSHVMHTDSINTRAIRAKLDGDDAFTWTVSKQWGKREGAGPHDAWPAHICIADTAAIFSHWWKGKDVCGKQDMCNYVCAHMCTHVCMDLGAYMCIKGLLKKMNPTLLTRNNSLYTFVSFFKLATYTQTHGDFLFPMSHRK